MSPAAPPLPVVVGVDGTALSRDALVFALEEGALRGAVVRVVMAWTFGTTLHDAVPGESLESESALVRAELEAVLTQARLLAEVDAEVELRPVHGAFGESLVAEAREGALLVVGSGRKGPLARSFLGSVSDYCVRHSPVPVVVVANRAVL